MNRKIRRFFSIVLVACMLITIVPLHATSLTEEDSLSNELIVDNELSTNDTDIKGNSIESVLSSERELSSSTISDEVIEEIKTSDEIESSSLPDSEEEVEEQKDILTTADDEDELENASASNNEEVQSEQDDRLTTSNVETEELENENWEIGVVFYDSSVNNGKTPLTEIDWNASDGSYKEGTSRVITVQINYKNTNVIKAYQPGELAITIPNLIYNTENNVEGSPLWDSSVIVGANEPSRTGYDWTFIDGKTTPSEEQETYIFYNDIPFEEKANFEGTIQIIYTITPKSELAGTINNVHYTSSEYAKFPNDYIEGYDDECTHSYLKTLQASLKRTTNIADESQQTTITSPNWPNPFPKNMSKDEYYWENNYPLADFIILEFDNTCNLDSKGSLYFYNKKGENICKQLTGYDTYIRYSYMANKTYVLYDSYIKLAMSSGDNRRYKGFSVKIMPVYYPIITLSNKISIEYNRKYTHPWEKAQYTISKTASKISTMDLFPSNSENYIWVKYSFKKTGDEYSSGFFYTRYPKIFAYPNYFVDEFPDGCIVYDSSMNKLEPIYGNTYKEKMTDNSQSIYVGYPRSIYNEENGNLNISNTVQLVGTYYTEDEESLLAEGKCSLNLADFEFAYSGNLYGLTKFFYKPYNSIMQYQKIVGDNNAGTNTSEWHLSTKSIYTGTPMTVKIGDDLLYATDVNGNYSKLNDDEYYFSRISWDNSFFRNLLGYSIQQEKYDCELYIRHANSNDYELIDSFKNKYKSWTFAESDKIVGFYFIVYDMEESLSGSYGTQSGWINSETVFKKKDIPQNGQLHNFGYLQVFFKDENGNLILQNEPEIDSYSNFITKEEIATFDMETYGTYMQRSTAKASWQYYKAPISNTYISSYKYFGDIYQNEKEEIFTGDFTIQSMATGNGINIDYKDQYNTDYDNYKEYALNGLMMYDLLPNGMEIVSNEEEIVESFVASLSNVNIIYNTELEKIDFSDVIEKSDIIINIINNWRKTGRTFIEIKIPFKEAIFTTSNNSIRYPLNFYFNIKYKISYDAILEYGKIFTNYCYVGQLPNQKHISFNNSCKDTGVYDKNVVDINGNEITDEYLSYYKAAKTITNAFSTHQDVIKYAETDKSNYSTGTVESSYESEYGYKLRVRTGQNDITNLVIYDSIEEYAQNPNGDIVPAYGSKSHWNGEFLGIDTSYAESKGYVVKPYYSENVLAGNLYNNDGILNDDWIEYLNDDEDIYEYGKSETITSPNWPNNYNNNMTETKSYWEISYPGVESIEIKFDSTCKLESASYDYLRFYDKDGNNITSSVCGISVDKIGSSDMAGKTYTIPSDYVKITMRTDSNSQYKGFSADVVSKIFKETHYGTDKSKVKALAFEYLDTNGNPSKLPANSLTYVLIKMKSPTDENITSLAYNGCRTQWQALDDYDRPVDFITGINSNIVKVSLPNSVEDKEVNLSFNKIIDATDTDFERLKLDKDADYNFFISLTNQETGEVINGLLDSKEGFRVNNIPIGTYIIKEQNDIWFSFVGMALMEPIEGIEFKEENGAYIITIGATVESGATANIEITNKPDEERFYDSKYDIKNLFNLTK